MRLTSILEDIYLQNLSALLPNEMNYLPTCYLECLFSCSDKYNCLVVEFSWTILTKILY